MGRCEMTNVLKSVFKVCLKWCLEFEKLYQWCILSV